MKTVLEWYNILYDKICGICGILLKIQEFFVPRCFHQSDENINMVVSFHNLDRLRNRCISKFEFDDYELMIKEMYSNRLSFLNYEEQMYVNKCHKWR